MIPENTTNLKKQRDDDFIETPFRYFPNLFYIRLLKQFIMLKIGQLKAGDIINVDDEGIIRKGTIVKISHEENPSAI